MYTYVLTACLILLNLQLQLGYKDIAVFLQQPFFKSRLLKMAATVMTVECGTFHHYSCLEENSETCLSSSLNR